MQQKRAGPLFSRTGCLSAVGLALIMGMIIRFRGGDLFSPGSLSAMNQGGHSLSGAFSHAEFEEECSRCHVPWRGVSSELCQFCHEDVADKRLSGSGLHGRVGSSSNNGQKELAYLSRGSSHLWTSPLSSFTGPPGIVVDPVLFASLWTMTLLLEQCLSATRSWPIPFGA